MSYSTTNIFRNLDLKRNNSFFAWIFRVFPHVSLKNMNFEKNAFEVDEKKNKINESLSFTDFISARKNTYSSLQSFGGKHTRDTVLSI